MSDETRPRYDRNQAPLSPESQLRLLLAGVAVACFLFAAWIFGTSADVHGFMWLSFGLAAVAGGIMIPPPPGK